MLAAYAARQSADDPLSGLEVGERPDPAAARRAGRRCTLRTAGLNHHDVWSLRGVGLPADRLPMVLGCDGAGVDADGNEVIVHAVVPSDGWRGDETLDPRRTLLSELHDGTLAEQVAVPVGNLVPKPAGLSLGARRLPVRPRGSPPTGCCSPTPGVQPGGDRARPGRGRRGGHGPGPARARRPGYRMWVTSPRRGARASGPSSSAPTGRSAAVSGCPSGSTPSWRRSAPRRGRTRSTRCVPGGTIVICGATSGDAPAKAELTKIFFKQLRVVGSTMGTRAELERLARFVAHHGIEPVVDTVLPLADARDGFARMADGEVFGKVVFTVS